MLLHFKVYKAIIKWIINIKPLQPFCWKIQKIKWELISKDPFIVCTIIQSLTARNPNSLNVVIPNHSLLFFAEIAKICWDSFQFAKMLWLKYWQYFNSLALCELPPIWVFETTNPSSIHTGLGRTKSYCYYVLSSTP